MHDLDAPILERLANLGEEVLSVAGDNQQGFDVHIAFLPAERRYGRREPLRRIGKYRPFRAPFRVPPTQADGPGDGLAATLGLDGIRPLRRWQVRFADRDKGVSQRSNVLPV